MNLVAANKENAAPYKSLLMLRQRHDFGNAKIDLVTTQERLKHGNPNTDDPKANNDGEHVLHGSGLDLQLNYN